VTPRSWLYVPGGDATKLSKAFDQGADALIVDLEDTVPSPQKPAARRAVAQWLADIPDEATQVWVRISPGAPRVEDVRAVAGAPRLTGVVAAKTESAEDVLALDATLARSGCEVPIIPLLESGAAVLAAADIARVPRVLRLQVGEVDLMADLGVPDTGGDEALATARGLVVLASAAARRDPPIAPVARNFRDMERFRASTLRLRALGYLGRACIHPAQVAVANEVFTPGAEEVDRARDLIRRFDSDGGGVVLDRDGAMVDEAVVRQARRLLSLVR